MQVTAQQPFISLAVYPTMLIVASLEGATVPTSSLSWHHVHSLDEHAIASRFVSQGLGKDTFPDNTVCE